MNSTWAYRSAWTTLLVGLSAIGYLGVVIADSWHSCVALGGRWSLSDWSCTAAHMRLQLDPSALWVWFTCSVILATSGAAFVIAVRGKRASAP